MLFAKTSIEQSEVDLCNRLTSEAFVSVAEIRGNRAALYTALSLWKGGVVDVLEQANGSLILCVTGEGNDLSFPAKAIPYTPDSIERLSTAVRGPQRGAKLVGTDDEYRVVEDLQTGERRRVVTDGDGDWTDEMANKVSALDTEGTRPLFPRLAEKVM